MPLDAHIRRAQQAGKAEAEAPDEEQTDVIFDMLSPL